jgi:hypothetical protein
MSNRKINLSSGDKLSIFIASIALISALFTTYIQFFHKTTAFRIGHFDFLHSEDSLSQHVDINILLMNTGTNPVALTEWNSFLSANESLTNGTCYYDNINLGNSALYTYGCRSHINEIIEPNVVEFIDLHLAISNIKLSDYMELNEDDETNDSPQFRLGVYLKFVDSNGKKVDKELIIGDIQFNDKSTLSRYFILDQKELTIY